RKWAAATSLSSPTSGWKSISAAATIGKSRPTLLLLLTSERSPAACHTRDLPAREPTAKSYRPCALLYVYLASRSAVFSAHNLVLDTLQIFEEEGVVAGGRIFRILPWRTHYRCSYFLQLRMQPIDFDAGCRFECKMM